VLDIAAALVNARAARLELRPLGLPIQRPEPPLDRSDDLPTRVQLPSCRQPLEAQTKSGWYAWLICSITCSSRRRMATTEAG
jgi:hypothetical protein